MFWLLLGALPAYGLYKFALAAEMTVSVKQEQAYLARAFAWRGCKIQDDFRLIPVSTDILERRINMSPTGVCRDYSDVYPATSLSRDVKVAVNLADLARTYDGMVALRFWRYVAKVAPIYNETTTYSRYLGPFVVRESTPHPGGARWAWQVTSGGAPMLVYQHGERMGCDALVPSIASRLTMAEPHFGWPGLLSALALLALLFAWCAFGARKLFFGGIEEDARRMNSASAPPIAPSLYRDLNRLDQAPDLEWAKAECKPIFDVASHIPEETLKHWCKTCTTRRAVADRILNRARSFYDREWKQCNEEAKLLLIQLVEEGFANPKQPEVVRELLKRGLLLRDPVLRPMNQSFALFVQAQVQPEKIHEQEQVHRGLRWSLVRTLLVAALLLILVFLTYTQRDLVEVWIAYIGTAAGGAAAVLKLLSPLGRGTTQKMD
jgi:hypothetical protein